ncbi:MAG: phosphodiesterase [Erysipelotrichaceae bacterium]|jgi:putative phosphoesterase|nr:phosphodiesterase [Erysipelotrichaceae bacterium]MCR5096048.1 phosphodiesterase [Erysipelotrichaceae bacterium]
MKLMIASDIHGSAYYNDLLVERFREEKPDKLLLLGDILYHGPRNDLPAEYVPKRVLASLNELKDRILCVRGNCDGDVDQMVLEFPIMADYLYMYIEGIEIYASHGHIYNQNKPLPGLKGIFLCGHTHVPLIEKHDDFVYLNPGSVSIPKDGSRHSYMIFENREFLWKDLENKEIYMNYKV